MGSKSISIKGCDISYSEKGQGQTIVFLHGYLETKEVWDNFSDYLAKQFHVICIDIPGHGKSENFAEVHNMDLLADRINELLVKLDVPNYTLVGHSMGGYVSLAIANAFGEKLNGLVLFHSSLYADTDDKKKNRQREIDFFMQGKKDLILSVNLPNMFANDNVERCASELTQIHKRASLMGEEGICALLRGMMNRKDQQQFVKEFTKPMLFIFGEKDNYIPVETGQKMLTLNANIKGAWLEDSGHMGFVEEPEASVKIISEFVLNLE